MPDDGVVQVQLTADGSRPVDLPTQFATIGDMVTSYTELQGAHTKLSQANATVTTPVTPAPSAKKKDDGLTPEMRSALETMGNFNESQRKIRFEAQVGPEGMVALDAYIAGDTIDPGMKAAYEAALDAGNEALVDANFALIRSVFEAANGPFQAPQNMVAGAAGGVLIPTGTTAFNSLDEQLAAQRDPKYKTDPSFRKGVENRIAISGPYTV